MKEFFTNVLFDYWFIFYLLILFGCGKLIFNYFIYREVQLNHRKFSNRMDYIHSEINTHKLQLKYLEGNMSRIEGRIRYGKLCDKIINLEKERDLLISSRLARSIKQCELHRKMYPELYHSCINM